MHGLPSWNEDKFGASQNKLLVVFGTYKAYAGQARIVTPAAAEDLVRAVPSPAYFVF